MNRHQSQKQQSGLLYKKWTNTNAIIVIEEKSVFLAGVIPRLWAAGSPKASWSNEDQIKTNTNFLLPRSFLINFMSTFHLVHLCNWMDLAFKATESDMWNRNTSEVRQIYINKYDDKLFLFSLDIHFLKSNVLNAILNSFSSSYVIQGCLNISLRWAVSCMLSCKQETHLRKPSDEFGNRVCGWLWHNYLFNEGRPM